MRKLFLSGSRSFHTLNDKVLKKKLDFFIEKNYQILVGDAHGADALFQEYLVVKNYFNVVVYTIYEYPRVLLSDKFTVKKINSNEYSGRKAQEEKDKAMSEKCDYALILWDGKSKGSWNNFKRCKKLKKDITLIIINN